MFLILEEEQNKSKNTTSNQGAFRSTGEPCPGPPSPQGCTHNSPPSLYDSMRQAFATTRTHDTRASHHTPGAFNAPVRSDDDLLAQRATATVAQRFNSHLPPPSRAFAPLLTWPQPGLFLLRPQEPKGGAVPSPSSRLLSFAPVPSKSHLARGASANRSSRLRGAGCRRPPRCQEAGDGFAWHRKRQVLTPGRGGDPAGLT